MPRWLIGFLLVLLLVNALLPVAAQVEEDEEDEVEVATEYLSKETPQAEAGEEPELPTPTAGVAGITIFPDFADSRFPAGVTVEALIGLTNFNDGPFHVDYIRGMVRALAPPYPFIQNFSGALYNTTVRPGTEACLLYRFMADPSIATQEYEMLVELFYTNADNETYMATVHNGTVYLEDAPTTFGFQLLFAYLFMFAMAGGAGYGVWRFVKRNTRTHRSAPRGRRDEPREAGAAGGATREAGKETAAAAKGAIDWDYVSPDHAKFLQGKAPPAPRKESPARKESPSRKGRTSPNRKGASAKAE